MFMIITTIGMSYIDGRKKKIKSNSYAIKRRTKMLIYYLFGCYSDDPDHGIFFLFISNSKVNISLNFMNPSYYVQ